MRNSFILGAAGMVVASVLPQAARAQSTQAAAPSATQAAPAAPASVMTDAPMANVSDYFANWFKRVDQAQASQPHWMTPLVTVTPRLEEEVRYDQYFERLGTGTNVTTYDSGKGLELIPTGTNEILINPPPFVERTDKKPAAGFGDDPILIIKQRLYSANEQDGNYIVTAFLGLTQPLYNKIFSANAYVVTPTIAFGKGWGDFDFQATVGVPVPLSHEKIIGTSIAANITAQYHFATYFWPEVEANYTYWADGLRGGKNQLFITPGVILGRFQLYDRVRLIIGGGYQYAVTPKLTKEPVLTPLYDHAWIITARAAF